MMLFAGNCASSERSATWALDGNCAYSFIVTARLLWIEPAGRGARHLPRLGGRSTPFAAGCGLSRDALALSQGETKTENAAGGLSLHPPKPRECSYG
jgi:hypothetical protein